MPMYYFNIRERDHGLIADEEGREFSTEAEALGEGHASARDLAAASVKSREPLDAWTLEVRDAAGSLIKVISAFDVIKLGKDGSRK